MAKDRSLVRASDLGTWQFCQRAWWLANVQEVAHERPELFAKGNAAHADHGHQVQQAARMRTIGLALLLAAGLLLLLITLWLIR